MTDSIVFRPQDRLDPATRLADALRHGTHLELDAEMLAHLRAILMPPAELAPGSPGLAMLSLMIGTISAKLAAASGAHFEERGDAEGLEDALDRLRELMEDLAEALETAMGLPLPDREDRTPLPPEPSGDGLAEPDEAEGPLCVDPETWSAPGKSPAEAAGPAPAARLRETIDDMAFLELDAEMRDFLNDFATAVMHLVSGAEDAKRDDEPLVEPREALGAAAATLEFLVARFATIARVTLGEDGPGLDTYHAVRAEAQSDMTEAMSVAHRDLYGEGATPTTAAADEAAEQPTEHAAEAPGTAEPDDATEPGAGPTRAPADDHADDHAVELYASGGLETFDFVF